VSAISPEAEVTIFDMIFLADANPNSRLVDRIIRYPSVKKTYGLTIVLTMQFGACKGLF
jgi:hypothetical protein